MKKIKDYLETIVITVKNLQQNVQLFFCFYRNGYITGQTYVIIGELTWYDIFKNGRMTGQIAADLCGCKPR